MLQEVDAGRIHRGTRDVRMDMKALAKLHQEASPNLAQWRVERVLLWYADLALEADEEWVSYHCPKCGAKMSMALPAFLSIDKWFDSRCKECWGTPEEYGGE